jgi:hypothetical protein
MELRMGWAWNRARQKEMINAYKILVGNLKGRELMKSADKWEDDIKMKFRKIGLD